MACAHRFRALARRWPSHAAALAWIVLAEIFLCNFQFFRTFGAAEQRFSLSAPPETMELHHLSVSGDMARLDAGGDVWIEIRGLDLPARNVYLDFQDMRIVSDFAAHNALDFEIQMIDESHNRFYNRGGAKTAAPSVERSKYIPIHPMGNLKALRILFQSGQEGTQARLPAISLNRPQPLFFSPLRVVLFFALFCLCHALRPGSAVYAIAYDPASVRQRRITLAALGAYGAMVLLMAGYCQGASLYWSRNPYDLLAHALSRGEVSLETEMPADERLIALEDPYNPSSREGIGYTWDCAFYKGKYYVYYGVTPELLLYLPHYLLTGKDLGVTTPARIELAALIIGIYFLFAEGSKRFRPPPYAVWLALLLAAEAGTQTILLARTPIFYNIPVIMSLAMTVWGLYFWLSATRNGNPPYSRWRIAAGSVCMALVAGCRPQMALGSLLAIPIFLGRSLPRIRFARARGAKGRAAHGQPAKGRPAEAWRHGWREAARCLLCGALPYLLFGAFLLWYNAARFGNPFEFGARYNLTSIDVTRVGADFGKIVPGLFQYFFQPPRLSTVFPFLRPEPYFSSYQGDFFSHDSLGGFLICNPYLLFLCCGPRRWKRVPGFPLKVWIALSGGIALAITLVNLMIGGFMPRYFCDMAPFFHTACLPLLFLLLGGGETGVPAQAVPAPGQKQGAPAIQRENDTLAPVVCMLCAAALFYHYFTFYYTDGGAMLNRYDREVFVRAAAFWQWWE